MPPALTQNTSTSVPKPTISMTRSLGVEPKKVLPPGAIFGDMRTKYTIAPEGPSTARLAVVCEKPAIEEVKQGRLLVGESGRRVREHLWRAGLDAGSLSQLSKDVWLTNAVQSFDEIGNPTQYDIIREQPRLFKELCSLPNLNCILAMGAMALESLTNFRYADIGHRRGSRLLTAFGTKLLPTWHPAFYMRGNWELASIVQFDTDRAVKESKWPEIQEKQRFWNIRPAWSEAMEWLQYLKTYPPSKSPYISYDLETVRGKGGTWYISSLAFSVTPEEAFCIPLIHKDRSPYFTEIYQECQIWRAIAELFSSPERIWVGQNLAAFDNWVLRRHGIIPPRGPFLDTYSMHSLLAPDLPHRLDFITSIYTDAPYYKDESGRGDQFGLVDEDAFWVYNCKDAALTLEAALAMKQDMEEL